ncbi:hypothetical protein ACP275_05G003700 [Erythranthe tilingii]
MGKIATKMPNFCLNRIRPLIRLRSPPMQYKNNENEVKKDASVKVEKEEYSGGGAEKQGSKSGRKVMIVVDSSPESKIAVQWALTHTVQNQDLVILLYVTKPSGQGDQSTIKVPEFVTCMKSSCQLKWPQVYVEAVVVEAGQDYRGPAIVEAAKKQGVALLVLGQKKRSFTWRLMLMWAGNRAPTNGGGVAEYCVQNASCMAIAVRRKSKKLGGYLITTKRQKDFWLLA